MTLASEVSVGDEDTAPTSDESGPSMALVAPAPASEFHLVESANEWTLTITMTEQMRNALLLAQDTPGEETDVEDAVITVHVQPNLLPGVPFPATVVINHSD